MIQKEILKLKKEKVESPEQRHNIVNELDRLNTIYEKQEGYASRHMVNLYLELLEVNTEIWDIEEEMRVIMYAESPPSAGGAGGSSYYGGVQNGLTIAGNQSMPDLGRDIRITRR